MAEVLRKPRQRGQKEDFALDCPFRRISDVLGRVSRDKHSFETLFFQKAVDLFDDGFSVRSSPRPNLQEISPSAVDSKVRFSLHGFADEFLTSSPDGLGEKHRFAQSQAVCFICGHRHQAIAIFEEHRGDISF
eukprot:CAMPEP_0194779312 /NCGR_PEP_ID=MMETSP0323_2-20130528/70709_1 /TAXON_ID=2866 ORGANISM="Crypthecodinium cohnii, Strain Seligo" /NCGR_SAMPLE_ID=MMETSP0323_2 /ASSEMBLY_ACC=CAM_ASM_000346 /LENGTH=132 /DNA_ID=CAMNT_0039716911 /DNA_START=516 /DNA_END=914 /DNA_ORIENTATION=-